MKFRERIRHLKRLNLQKWKGEAGLRKGRTPSFVRAAIFLSRWIFLSRNLSSEWSNARNPLAAPSPRRPSNRRPLNYPPSLNCEPSRDVFGVISRTRSRRAIWTANRPAESGRDWTGQTLADPVNRRMKNRWLMAQKSAFPTEKPCEDHYCVDKSPLVKRLKIVHAAAAAKCSPDGADWQSAGDFTAEFGTYQRHTHRV